MLPPEEWKQLYKAQESSKREIKRLTQCGEFAASCQEEAELARIQKIIAEQNDGSDPWAPWGGLDSGCAQVYMAIPLAAKSLFKSQKHRKRSLYFILVANAQLCLGAGYATQYFLWWLFSRREQVHLATCLYACGGALAVASAIVLHIERRARCRVYDAQRVQAKQPAAVPAIETRAEMREPDQQSVLSVSLRNR